MSTAMVSIENAPRDLQGLLQLKRTILFRLAHSLSMFADETQEAAFNQAPTDQMCQALIVAIQQYDAARGGAPAPAPAAPAPPPAPAPMQMPMAQPFVQGPPAAVPGAQIALPAMPQAAQQPVMPGIQMPPQMPPPMPAMAVQPPPAPMPAVVPPQMPVVAPPMPAAPQMPQAAPMAPALPPPIAMPPAVAQQPVRAPATKAATQAVVPTATAPQAPASAPVGMPAGGQILQIQQQVALSLQQLADTSQKTQQWLEEQQTGQAMLLSAILATQLYLAEQSGIGADMVAKGIKQMGPEAVSSFLQALGQEGGK